MDKDQFICESIVRALKSGLVPARGIGRIAVGRDDETKQIQRDLEFAKQGGAWVKIFSGDYGVGKTFLCSLVREEAWKAGFIVSAVDLGRESPFHRLEVVYRQIVEGMRTEHFRDVPAFEFIIQEWLFNLEKEVQRAKGLNPLNPDHRAEVASIVEHQINEHLAQVRIYDTSFANALRGYYMATQHNNEAVATAAMGWLKGEPNVPARLRQEFNIRGTVGRDNALSFIRAIATLVVSIGYSGLILILDEAELIRGIARTDSRNAAYENIRLLMDKTAWGEFNHCGFLFAGTEDLFNDEIRGIPSYQALHDRLKPERGQRPRKDVRQSLLPLEGFDRLKLLEAAMKVRDVHGTAYGWQPAERLTDRWVHRIVDDVAGRFGEKFKTVPRGFLKVIVDILDELQQNPTVTPEGLLTDGIDADSIEDIEREEAHLFDVSPLH